MSFWKLAVLLSLISVVFIFFPFLKRGRKSSYYVFVGFVALLAFLLPLFIYLNIGNFEAIAESQNSVKPAMGHGDAKAGNLNLEGMTLQLEKKLEANPDNLDGWVLLAKTYCEIQDYPKALTAFKMAAKLAPKDANLLADYADILVLTKGGVFDANSEGLIDRALLSNPSQAKALLLKATILFDRKDYKTAILIWKKLLKSDELPEAIKSDLKANIAEAIEVSAAAMASPKK
jgi:cytochrome c-type biogenesis protein CcmH